MFANLVRVALAVECLAWAALGAWLGAGLPAIAAGTLAGALGVRLLLVGTTLGLSWLARSPRAAAEQLGPAATVALVAGEWRAMLLNNFVWLPFERTVLRADPPLAPEPRLPVILVHGYFSNRGTLCALARALDRAGAGPVFVPSLPAILAPIEDLRGPPRPGRARSDRSHRAAPRHPRLPQHGRARGARLAGRARRRAGRGHRHPGEPPPWHDARVAGRGRERRQMRRGASSSTGSSGRARARGVPALSVYTVHDNLVAPQDSSRLEWARNVAVAGVGHLAMLADARVHREVLEEIARLRAGAAA